MPIPESFLEELAERNDIADVVSGYVRLTRRSGVNQFGLCPFHSEKTPSFSVNTERQIYHCFGCGKSGGVINFIMEIENLSFPDAVQFLARRAGMQVPEDEQDDNRSRRARMLELNREAARFFHSRLLSDEGRAAQEYIVRRGITNMVTPFGLGYAPDTWDSLINAMAEKGFSRAELIEASLAAAGKNGGAYDFFRHRLMFPVIDVRGSVIGFSGRVLDDREPKYLNSRDTLVYSKARSLFAMNLAKKSKSGYILLAEGNIDVVSLHQAGFDSAVASLGTSLTADQARLIARYTKELVIAYDNDGAGHKAAQRAITLLAPLDLKVKVLQIPDAKDPDEFIQTRGPQAFRDLIEKSGNQIEYRLQQTAAEYDLDTDAGRSEYLKAAAQLIASLPNGVDREIYGIRAAEKAGVSKEAFLPEVERARKKQSSAARKREDREATAPLRAVQPKARELRYENVQSARAEEGLIQLLYRYPELFGNVTLSGSDFSSDVLGRLFDALVTRVREGKSVSLAVLSGQFTPEEISLLTGIIGRDDMPPSSAGDALDDYIQIIQETKDRASLQDDPLAYAEKLKQKKGYGG